MFKYSTIYIRERNRDMIYHRFCYTSIFIHPRTDVCLMAFTEWSLVEVGQIKTLNIEDTLNVWECNQIER